MKSLVRYWQTAQKLSYQTNSFVEFLCIEPIYNPDLEEGLYQPGAGPRIGKEEKSISTVTISL